MTQSIARLPSLPQRLWGMGRMLFSQMHLAIYALALLMLAVGAVVPGYSPILALLISPMFCAKFTLINSARNEQMLLALPVSRREYILARYLTMAAFVGFLTAAALLGGPLHRLLSALASLPQITLALPVSYYALVLIITTLSISLTIPLSLFFSPSVLMVAQVLVFVVLNTLTSKLLNHPEEFFLNIAAGLNKLPGPLSLAVSLIISLLILWISYRITCAAYRRKQI